MRKSIVAAAAIAIGLSIGVPARNAAAMPVATPGQLGLAGAAANKVEKTAIVCGYYGCRRVWGGYWGPRPYWGGYWGRRPWGWHRPWGRGWRRW
jgi:hypothetical protein